MPRGGARPNSGPSPSWNLGKTRTIRIPIALADTLMQIARWLDDGNPLLEFSEEDREHMTKSLSDSNSSGSRRSRRSRVI